MGNYINGNPRGASANTLFSGRLEKRQLNCFPMNLVSSHMLVFQFPVGHPECGWEGEFCRSDTWLSENAKASIATILIVFCIITCLILTAFQRYRYTYVCTQNVYAMIYIKDPPL